MKQIKFFFIIFFAVFLASNVYAWNFGSGWNKSELALNKAPILFEERDKPSTPPANKQKLYLKTDGKLYLLDETGTETEVGSGSGGGSGDEITDADGDTKVEVEANADEDIIRFTAGGTATAMMEGSDLTVDGVVWTEQLIFTNPSVDMNIQTTDQEGTVIINDDCQINDTTTISGSNAIDFTNVSGVGDEKGHLMYNGTDLVQLTGDGVTFVEDINAENDNKGYSIDGSLFLSGHGTNLQNIKLGVEAGDSLETGAERDILIGYQAGKNLTTSDSNVFIGYQSGYSNTTGEVNIGIGSWALYSNTDGDTNVAIGDGALYSNTTGYSNIANGSYALYSNTVGAYNTAVGANALYANTSGNYNCAVGEKALYDNTTGSNNMAFGKNALKNNTIGDSNTAIGTSALSHNITGTYNTANGYVALRSNITGSNNTANGAYALYSNTTGSQNTANGYLSLYSNTTGYNNTANGHRALYSNTTGSQNTATGLSALYYLTGSGNVAVGYEAGRGDTSGFNNANYNTILGYRAGYSITDNSSYNVFIGNQAGYNETGSNKLYIDNSNTSSPLIYGDFSSDFVKINGGHILKRTTVSDADYTALTSDYLIAVTSMTASRTITLPTTGITVGQSYIIKDEGGNASTYSLVIDPEGSATIDGNTTYSISNDYDSITVYYNGTNYYII